MWVDAAPATSLFGPHTQGRRLIGVDEPPAVFVLPLTHMDMIGVRELQQHASAALRRVARGETLGVTDRGRLVAVLAPPSTATGAGALLASGRVQPAVRSLADLPEPVAATTEVSEVLEDLRADR